YFAFFFFSSRRRHTRFSRDWSSDVCSSDLAVPTGVPHITVAAGLGERLAREQKPGADDQALGDGGGQAVVGSTTVTDGGEAPVRSEERRVGKGWIYGRSPRHDKK